MTSYCLCFGALYSNLTLLFLVHLVRTCTIGNQYGDITANMGVSTDQVGGPLSCYNAGHHWALGWFPEGRVQYLTPPDSPVRVSVVAFVDVKALQSNEYVLVRVGSYYMQYNKAKLVSKTKIVHSKVLS